MTGHFCSSFLARDSWGELLTHRHFLDLEGAPNGPAWAQGPCLSGQNGWLGYRHLIQAGCPDPVSWESET